jgi:bacterioferritin (cytochrome b1)
MQIVTPKEQINFETNKRLLNRYRFVEYETLRILAGWLPAAANMDYKLAMGRLLWEDAEHVQHLYRRLREIQTPAFRPPGDEALEHLMAEAIHAPNERDLLAGLFRVIKPALVGAYHWHLAQTFANPDAPTLYAFKHILIDEEEQLHWAEEALAGHPTGEWERYISDLLAAAGGITGDGARHAAPAAPAIRTEFVAVRKAARDPRFTLINRRAGQIISQSDVTMRRQMEFESYSQEMLAAETVAQVIYLSPQMPWEFTYDSARHCYDETRHCKLGIEWLAQHGFDYTDVAPNTRIFEWRSQYDPATQYVLLTMGNEVHAFPYRHESIAAYQQVNDQLSIQYINYDMADERQHVAYGKKWIPKLMAAHGIDKPVEQFIDETVALWEAEYRSGALPIHANT